MECQFCEKSVRRDKLKNHLHNKHPARQDEDDNMLYVICVRESGGHANQLNGW